MKYTHLVTYYNKKPMIVDRHNSFSIEEEIEFVIYSLASLYVITIELFLNNELIVILNNKCEIIYR